MADDQVDLTPEDIPGASYIEEEIEKLTVAQLNFWLKCLHINQNGNEKELVERKVYIIRLHAIDQLFLLFCFFNYKFT